ncbi:MAG: dihydroorotate dehydrogenase 1B [Candidatus Syntrophoarchaeum caldarius]|uniref:Dihydroorotate dehydrogenase n=1 Tax=Candidatus Syntropharchaeum caldarium TaxID=1838285 RepID=A0A1F2P8T2_9EURY|nr:MAG: dihydroorotate dehydrogenase 1B [Candidatus Syntrophoarchaeum caldarius]
MVDLRVNIGIELQNPLILSSGILGSSVGMLKRLAGTGAGALITKSITENPRVGHENPTVIEVAPGIILNAMGLPNPGVDLFLNELEEEDELKIPIIPSVAGYNEDEFGRVAARFEDAGYEMVELNISCPHSTEFSTGKVIAQDTGRTSQVISAVREITSLKLIVKLSPNVTDIVEFAEVALDAGADALSLINTLEALEVDPFFEVPVLGNIFGGQSGESVRCIAQRKIADIALAMHSDRIRNVPLIGIGGVRTPEDVFRFILLGVDAVGIGSSILYEDLAIFENILDGLERMMVDKGYESLDVFRGKAILRIAEMMV